MIILVFPNSAKETSPCHQTITWLILLRQACFKTSVSSGVPHTVMRKVVKRGRTSVYRLDLFIGRHSFT